MLNRRSFLASSAASLAAASLPHELRAAGSKLMIGLDHFAVRGTGWKAPQFLDYAIEQKLDTLFLSELGVFESFEDTYLKPIKEKADAAGIKLYVGTGSVCDSSNTWKAANGTGIEHLALTIRIAKALGSPVARCYLGNQKDRTSDGGIEKHIEQTIKVIKANQSRAEAEGIKIAIENHAGDMRATELKTLIETAGKSYVGANIDPGNAVWVMDEPLAHLEILGPLTVCSSVRDSMIWEDENGAVVQWTAVGEGQVDFKAYAKRFAELAPGVPLNIETISGFAKPISWKNADYMKMFPGVTESDIAPFIAMSKKGKKLDPFKAPDGPGKKDAEIAYQKGEFERSVKWLRENAA
jgi:3-oxoisoapionate decarboxylase